jgi:protein phosphatase
VSEQIAAGIRALVGARTDPGRRRQVNEDAALASQHLVVVADGMGGHEHGARASAAVIRAFEPLAAQRLLRRSDVATAISAAHREVADLGGSRGAGSTVTGLALVVEHGRPRWLVFNVGDSRVYRLHEGRLAQLTLDHSVVQELVDAGELSPEQASSYAGRNVITRAIGADLEATGAPGADYLTIPVVTGDRLLVCSDGLTTEVDDERIADVLARAGQPQAAADELVERALVAGGRDNVTVVVLDVIEGWPEPAGDAPEETTLTGLRRTGRD